jgi:hypothetical protein
VDAGSGKLTNCSSGSEGGWGCLGFDRNHADNGERVKVAQWIHGSKAREEKWGAGIWCLATRLRRGGLVWWPTTPRARRRRAAAGGWCGAIAWTWAVEGGEVWVCGPATGPVAGASLR